MPGTALLTSPVEGHLGRMRPLGSVGPAAEPSWGWAGGGACMIPPTASTQTSETSLALSDPGSGLQCPSRAAAESKAPGTGNPAPACQWSRQCIYLQVRGKASGGQELSE